MNDASVKTSALVPHKVRAVIRGGRGGITHSKNKTWVSGRASGSPSPAPDGRWERGRGGSSLGARGGRGGHATPNGHASHSASVSANVTEDEDDGVSDAGPSHFVTPPPAVNGTGKTWEELVKAREVERARAIREGKMDDPTKPKRLDEAITIVGTCQDMCPEFERYRRERENNLDKWECILDPDGKPTKKVDHAHAVKIYERGQGDKIIPSDLRPAPVLKRTLDYLFHELIPRGGFPDTQAFVRDRSRAVRNDFTIQQDTGPVAMECHERCTRFHILSLHLMYGISTFDRALEIQQLMNSLLSLKEFYDDQRGAYQSPNELEMRIYHRLGLIRDQHERNDRPPPHIASDRAFQLITRFRGEVQTASSPITKTSKMKVSAAAMQTFGELAGVLRERRNIVMIYLIACFLEHIFGKDTIDDMESIKGPLSIQDIIDGNSEVEGYDEAEDGVEDANMDEEIAQEEGEGDGDDLSAFIEDDSIAEDVDDGLLEVQQQDEEAPLPSPLKRGATQWLTENFGNAPTPPRDATISHSKSAPGTRLSSTSPFGGQPAQSSSGTVHSNESVFGKLVSSSSTPSILGNTGPPSAFGTALSAFGSNSNVFGGPVFGVSPFSGSSSTPPKIVEPTKQNTSPFSVHPPTSALPREKKELRSLADAAPLDSTGEEDRVDSSEAVKTPEAPPPFASSKSVPTLNPAAPSFEPEAVRASLSSTPFTAGTRASLAPIRTESLLQNVVDPNRGVFATPVASPSYPFPSPQKGQSGPSLSINTGPALKSNGETRKAYAIDSPVGPPPLSRKAPISLPGTPTASFSSSAIPPVGPMTPSTPYHFPGLQINISATTTSTPNVFPSSSSHLSLQAGLPPTPDRQPPTTSSPLANGSFTLYDEDSIDSPASSGSKRERYEQAHAFRRTHGIVPAVYRRWKQRLVDTATWKEACRRSEAYKQKIHESTTERSMPSSSSYKRQRSASAIEVEPSRSRRRLKRVSNPMERRTDEELAEKLMQNRKKHERRWARGLFVKAIQEYVQSRVENVPPNWATWLCMNPDNDKTAIWLEQKFDVPQSGSWESEAVFTIPVSANPSLEVFPGLIVFECTPLEGVDDEIERKYRVLDDCSRLRDIISMLPERRHYTPSLLFINWDSSPGSDIDSDVSDMAAKYVEDGILRNSIRITISSDDTDEAFAKCLPRLNADLQGELVERLHLSDLFDRLSLRWRETASVWVDACFSDETFNWPMFSHVVECFVESLNAMLESVLSVWNKDSSQVIPLPLPPFGKDRDDQSVPRDIYEWLRSSKFDADYLANHYLAAGFNQGTIFDYTEARALFDHLLHLAFLYAQQFANVTLQRRVISKANLKQASLQFADALEQAQARLRTAIKTLPRSSPKRKSNGDSNYNDEPSESASQASSPSPPTPSISAKRARVSRSSESVTDDQGQEPLFGTSPSPTTSAAPSVGNSSVSSVTVAMLRALSRDVLRTYGGKKREGTS